MTRLPFELSTADCLTVRPGQAVTYHQVAPPAHPTTLGDVWVGQTKPTPDLIMEFAKVAKPCTCGSNSLLPCQAVHSGGTVYVVNGRTTFRSDG